MVDALPILLLLAFGAAAWLLGRRRAVDERVVQVVAALAGCMLLYDALTEPSRRFSGLLFVFLAAVIVWRAGSFVRRDT